MLPTPTPHDAGDASFLGPSRAPTQKADIPDTCRTMLAKLGVLFPQFLKTEKAAPASPAGKASPQAPAA